MYARILRYYTNKNCKTSVKWLFDFAHFRGFCMLYSLLYILHVSYSRVLADLDRAGYLRPRFANNSSIYVDLRRVYYNNSVKYLLLYVQYIFTLGTHYTLCGCIGVGVCVCIHVYACMYWLAIQHIYLYRKLWQTNATMTFESVGQSTSIRNSTKHDTRV